jgi:hypothetical protein
MAPPPRSDNGAGEGDREAVEGAAAPAMQFKKFIYPASRNPGGA